MEDCSVLNEWCITLAQLLSFFSLSHLDSEKGLETQVFVKEEWNTIGKVVMNLILISQDCLTHKLDFFPLHFLFTVMPFSC